MRKKIILCLIVMVLLLPACGQQKIETDPNTVNIMCYSSQAREISELRLKAFLNDNSIQEPHYITEKDYENEEEWQNALHKSIMLQNPDIDIFSLYSLDQNAYKIIKDHFYVDLSQDEVLMESFDAMYPKIRKWCADGEELFGFPYDYFSYMTIMVDEEKTGRIGYGIDDFTTVTGLLAFCEAWRAEYGTPPIEGFTFIDWYYYNYILQHYDHETGEMDLDTPQFREILTQCRELPQREDIFERPTEETIYSFKNTYTAPVLFSYYSDTLKRYPQYTPVLYPRLTGEEENPKRMAYVIWFIVNPYSQKAEEALECIRWMAGPQASKYRESPLYRDTDSYTNSDYTQASLNAVGENLTHVDAAFNFPGFSEVHAACYGYIKGETDNLEEAVTEAQRILDTVQKEQYIGQ